MKMPFLGGSLALLLIAGIALVWPPILYILILVGPIIAIGIYDVFQAKHTIIRNFPFIGHFRYLLEAIGPELHQYFVENDTDGTPIDRNHRAYVYERALNAHKTHPFGTELDVYRTGYEWMHHSIYPAKRLEQPPRVTIGGPDCRQPYAASLFNISAMSFGSLSANAVRALNQGASEGGFYHNTGEGGVSSHHLLGGDLVWEIGTGYFGCRDSNGGFSREKFREQAVHPNIKMIEIKLSQGAKPGHGGVLPAEKNNEEIAEIRGLEPHTTIISPPHHTAFNNARGLLEFVQTLRDASEGKPVGFKLCVGDRKEFREICEAMVETGIKPDFITVDGAEGGTGAAPIVFSNYVGMTMEEGLVCVVDDLRGYNLKKDIRVIVASKIITAFDIFRVLCLGADICNSARGMMLALGCIQALKCHTNRCPSGVATNNPKLQRGLVVEHKSTRVRNYQHFVIEDFLDLLVAAGVTELDQLSRSKIYKRVSNDEIHSFDELYPDIDPGSALVHPG